MDKGNELLFILVANLGKYFFINPLAMKEKLEILLVIKSYQILESKIQYYKEYKLM